jgi:nucleotide-binding universal stress UspA family protein
MGLIAIIEEVNNVDELMKYKINGIPALAVNNQVVLQKRVPGVEELKVLLKVFSNPFSNEIAMKRLLVPTDFSDAAADAYHFAMGLAGLQEGTLKVLHVYHPEFDPQNPYLTEPLAGLVEGAGQRLHDFVKSSSQLPGNSTSNVSTQVAIGFPVEEILERAYSGNFDMIVMGTTGQKGVLEKLFGSVSINVAQRAVCPVMLAPTGAKFNGFKHIVYASDYESITEATLSRLVALAKLFKSDINFVHVAGQNTGQDYKEIETRLFKLLFKDGEPAFSFTINKVEGSSITESLNDYAVRHKADLVVLVHPHRGFWESLFHKSITKQLALNTKIPLLVLHH